ncbi:MAG TPA: type IIL restriction-modification enzyme MmeI, partial [Gemmatimonadaceae bacterium]
LAQEWLLRPLNPNGRPNSDVLRPVANAADVVGRSRNRWIIDFGDLPLNEAALYEAPFEYVKKHIYRLRVGHREKRQAEYWWLHARPAPAMRQALARFDRYIATPLVAKHRIFVWLSREVLPVHLLGVFARDDDYFFGVLHSRAHEVWSLRMGTSLEDRPRYTPTSTFETFPFPWPPGQEPVDDPRVQAIADAARELNELRERWLNPEGASDAELKKRTLTKLYNQRPTWLVQAHARLDHAVWDAYGWDDPDPAAVDEDTILARLLALNLERAETTNAVDPD